MNQLTEIKASITGTIWKITTQIGAAVSEGDTLIIMESMKMEVPVEAEGPGAVHEICVKEGQPVSEGQVLVRLKG